VQNNISDISTKNLLNKWLIPRLTMLRYQIVNCKVANVVTADNVTINRSTIREPRSIKNRDISTKTNTPPSPTANNETSMQDTPPHVTRIMPDGGSKKRLRQKVSSLENSRNKSLRLCKKFPSLLTQHRKIECRGGP